MRDESFERVLKSFIDEKSLIKLLRVLEDENIENESLKIENKFRKIISKDIVNNFYNWNNYYYIIILIWFKYM